MLKSFGPIGIPDDVVYEHGLFSAFLPHIGSELCGSAVSGHTPGTDDLEAVFIERIFDIGRDDRTATYEYDLLWLCIAQELSHFLWQLIGGRQKNGDTCFIRSRTCYNSIWVVVPGRQDNGVQLSSRLGGTQHGHYKHDGHVHSEVTRRYHGLILCLERYIKPPRNRSCNEFRKGVDAVKFRKKGY